MLQSKQNEKPPYDPPASAALGAERPNDLPLPDHYLIPESDIVRWLALSPTDAVEVRLTRPDLDNLFFGIVKSLEAQELMHDCLVKWTNNDIAGANEALAKSRFRVLEGHNHTRQFFGSIMRTAKKNG